MPLFEIGDDELVPFRRVQAGPDLYESEIEDLLWANLDTFVGVPLFPLARQPVLGEGLRPDIVALDVDGRVLVIEIKRDVDRRQLAQCLEYAGWARTTSLDELAGMFDGGADEFFAAWAEFTDTEAPRLVKRPPQLVLVARDFDARTDAALSYLTENDLPITVLRVTVYEDQQGRRFVEVGADHELEIPKPAGADGRPTGPTRYQIDGRRVTIADLIDHGLLEPDTELTWHRQRVGTTYKVKVLKSGQLELPDGRKYSAPVRAARESANIVASRGWSVWRTEDGTLLADLRNQLIDRQTSPQPDAPDEEPQD